jgi:hypothetical protein
VAQAKLFLFLFFKKDEDGSSNKGINTALRGNEKGAKHIPRSDKSLISSVKEIYKEPPMSAVCEKEEEEGSFHIELFPSF